MDALTEQVDNSMDIVNFIKASEEGIKREHNKCVAAMRSNKPLVALPAAGACQRLCLSLLASLANVKWTKIKLMPLFCRYIF